MTSPSHSSVSEGRSGLPSLDVAEEDHWLENLETGYPKLPCSVMQEVSIVVAVAEVDPSALRLDRVVDHDFHHNLLRNHFVIPWADILLVAGLRDLGEVVEIAVLATHIPAHCHNHLGLRIHYRHIQDLENLDRGIHQVSGLGILPQAVVLLEAAFAVADMP